MSHKGSADFGRWRAILWPVHRHELAKLLAMFFMAFFVCFNYTILRNMKDALVVTARSSGAEVIPFIKVWLLLPGAFVAAFIYTRLSNHFSQERIFYLMIFGFLLFFAVFAFVLFPMQDVLHPNAMADTLETMLPTGFRWFIAMIRNWTFTSFYVMSELWGVVAINILFWGFANQVTECEEATRFYSLFTMGGNVAAICAGQVAVYFSHMKCNFAYGKDPWEQTLVLLLLLVIGAGLATMLLFWWVNKYLIHSHSSEPIASEDFQSPVKKRSLRDSFRYLATSKYLICIAVLVLSYNLVINLVEVVWKDRLRQLCPNPQDFNTYMNYLVTSMGIVSTVMSIFTSVIVRKIGWRFTALVTPLMILMTCAVFFTFLFLPYGTSVKVAGFLGTTPLALVVFSGALQNCLSKAMKYSVFDTSKEMTFIPLPYESKIKGKAAIDGVGSRLGKSGGSVIHQGLLMVFGTLLASAPYISSIIAMIIAVWFFAVRSLDRQFKQLKGEDIDEMQPAGKLVTTQVATS